jgi:hypothetical protein
VANGARPPAGSSTRPNGASTPAGGDAAGEGPDSGFSATLPFKQTQNGSADGLGAGNEESPQSMSKLVNVPRPSDARHLLTFMAGSLALFVFSMQLTFLVRRRPSMATMGDDFDDWMGL